MRDGGGESFAFGPHLRSLRRDASLTLKAVAERAGLAVSTISKIENDRMSPTYDVLLKLSKGLAVDLVTLMVGAERAPVEAPAGRLDVTRAAERRAYPTGTYIYEPFAMRLTNRLMDPTFVHVTARSLDEFPDLVRHPGEECVYVISGAVEMHLEFYAPIRLEAGDSVYFDGRMGHAYVSVSEADAQILNICAGVGERDVNQLTNGMVTKFKD
jgi:transcriptional regulator with XRE-family HTH domain